MNSLDMARQLRRGMPNAGVSGPWQFGTIASISAATNTVGVYLDSNTGTITTGLSYLSSYFPVVGDAVVIGRMQASARSARFVIGRFFSGTQPRIIPPTNKAAPTGGPYIVGDVAWDTGYLGNWYCTVAGSPGTWKLLHANNLRASAYLAGAQNGTTGAFTVVNFDTKSYDPNNNFTTGAGAKYTAPVAGDYSVAGAGSFIGFVGTVLYASVVYKNGVEFQRGFEAVLNTSIGNTVMPVSCIVPLAAGDTVQLALYQASGGNLAFTTGSNFTFLDIAFIGQR